MVIMPRWSTLGLSLWVEVGSSTRDSWCGSRHGMVVGVVVVALLTGGSDVVVDAGLVVVVRGGRAQRGMVLVASSSPWRGPCGDVDVVLVGQCGIVLVASSHHFHGVDGPGGAC